MLCRKAAGKGLRGWVAHWSFGIACAVEDQFPFVEEGHDRRHVDGADVELLAGVHEAGITGAKGRAAGFRVARDVAMGQHAAADPLPALEDLHVDALFLEQQRGVEPGQAGADDDDFRAVLGPDQAGIAERRGQGQRAHPLDHGAAAEAD